MNNGKRYFKIIVHYKKPRQSWYEHWIVDAVNADAAKSKLSDYADIPIGYMISVTQVDLSGPYCIYAEKH